MEDRRASPVSEDAGIMSMQELQLLDENHTDGAISNEKLAKILERLKVAMSDLELNTFTCCVCDLFKKRKFFININLQAKKKATVLMKHMQEVLHFSDVNPPLPPYLVQEFVPLWEARPHLDGLLLSINGFQNPTPPSNPNEADFAYICMRLSRLSEKASQQQQKSTEICASKSFMYWKMSSTRINTHAA